MRPPSDPRTARSSDPWALYAPDDDAPWDRRGVVHLHRRAGFAATWGKIRRDLKDGLRPGLDRLLAGKAATDGVPADFAKTADLLGRTPRWSYALVLSYDGHLLASGCELSGVRRSLKDDSIRLLEVASGREAAPPGGWRRAPRRSFRADHRLHVLAPRPRAGLGRSHRPGTSARRPGLRILGPGVAGAAMPVPRP